MKLGDVRTIAKSHGIRPDHLSKAELIKVIQTEEGNFDCFGSASNGECDQEYCLWREDCLATAV
ncbi:MAG: SAP domain-containing protein, partial [Gallionella sp.]